MKKDTRKKLKDDAEDGKLTLVVLGSCNVESVTGAKTLVVNKSHMSSTKTAALMCILEEMKKKKYGLFSIGEWGKVFSISKIKDCKFRDVPAKKVTEEVKLPSHIVVKDTEGKEYKGNSFPESGFGFLRD